MHEQVVERGARIRLDSVSCTFPASGWRALDMEVVKARKDSFMNGDYRNNILQDPKLYKYKTDIDS